MSKKIRMEDKMGIVIETRNLNKKFLNGRDETRVLKDINLQVKKGEFLSIMGPSGSGKSTLLYLLGGLDNPTDGTVELNGVDISKLKHREISKLRRTKIGFVFQFYNLVQNISVEDNILLPIVMDGKNPKNMRRSLKKY